MRLIKPAATAKKGPNLNENQAYSAQLFYYKSSLPSNVIKSITIALLLGTLQAFFQVRLTTKILNLEWSF